MSSPELADVLLALETQLLHGDHRHDPGLAERLLAPGFREVHAGGGAASRAAVLDWLRNKDPAARWSFADFAVEAVSQSVALVTYQARQVAPLPATSQGARHVSLWVREAGRGDWQLYFHQSTRIA